MNSVQTVTLNSALSLKLGWVHSVHTQKPGRAHNAHVVGAAARTASLSRACRSRSQHRSHAQRAQVARIAPRSWAHVATSFSCPAQAKSRHHFQVATSWTTKPCRDIKSVSRHHSGHSRSRHQNQVATLLEATLCCDINFMSRPHLCPQWDF